MYTRQTQFYTVLDAKGATGIDKVIDVSDFRHVEVSIATANSANMTVKLAGSIEETMPTFTSAQSVSNNYDFIQMKDLEDASTLDGDTGLVLAGTDDIRVFEANINGLKWLTARVTAYAAGNVTVKFRLFND